MRPTRSTEELKRANSFKGFINKKDEDEISLNHEDEDGNPDLMIGLMMTKT